jgi:hypothetical protein
LTAPFGTSILRFIEVAAGASIPLTVPESAPKTYTVASAAIMSISLEFGREKVNNDADA